MSFSTLNPNQKSEINVTPLIDVLLVLLIIFMVIVPLTPTGLRAVVPQPPLKAVTLPPPEDTVILHIYSGANGGATRYSINRQAVAKPEVVSRLTNIFATRQERVMFVKGDPGLQFSSIAEAIGLGHQAMATEIGVLTPKSESAD
ncbi:MAG: biopolymer transporter ExbD [Acidobacteriaceae bacterium]